MNRADRSGFAAWWFSVDRLALCFMLALLGIGLLLSFAASPAISGGPGAAEVSGVQAAVDAAVPARREISAMRCASFPMP